MSRTAAVVGLSLTMALANVVHPVAQGRQTGGLVGTVEQGDGTRLEGVMVTAVSSALQGVRQAQTGANGSYESLGLPPGDYTVIFELAGFGNVEQATAVPLGVSVRSDASMDRALEAIFRAEVVAVQPTPLMTTQGGANISIDDTNLLPVGRDLFRLAELAPGLTTNTPNTGQVTINGAFAYDTLHLIDGVDINDNLFGTANGVFIEDAVQEVEVLTSGIGAEYGRFSGGVVNTITRSGGNTFTGSFRSNLYRPDWTARTPFEKTQGTERTGALTDNTTYETTLGGPVLKDRLWLFYANRLQRENRDETLDDTGASFVRTRNNDRNLVELTMALAPNHRVATTYVRNSTKERRPSFDFTIDPAGIDDRRIANDLFVATYSSVLAARVFAEVQVSQQRLGSRGLGGTRTDVVESPFISLTQGGGHYNAPFFDASDPEQRNNRQLTASVSYFTPALGAGTHSIKGGFEHLGRNGSEGTHRRRPTSCSGPTMPSSQTALLC